MLTETAFLTFWRELNAKLKAIHEPPADFCDASSFDETVTTADEAAMKIRAQRIRAYHVEEGFNI